jgi:hypothetical protein
MGGAVGAEQTRLRQGPGIAPVGLDLAGAGGIHGGEVRVGDDDLVAEGLETARYPFAVGRGLDQHPGTGPAPEHGGEAIALGADALLNDLTPLGEDVDLAVPLVHIDANMVHGWPLPFCGVDRGVLVWGSLCHHVKREASRLHPISSAGAGGAAREAPSPAGARRAHARARGLASARVGTPLSAPW